LLHRVPPRNFTVPMQQDLPVRAWLESPVSGCIEYPVDWNDTEVPAVRLSGPGGVRVLASFDRAPRHAAALRYGYFVNDDGEMVFAVSPMDCFQTWAAVQLRASRGLGTKPRPLAL
jgi:hypothetical protein